MIRPRALGRVVSAPVASLRVAAWTWGEAHQLHARLDGRGLRAIDRVRSSPSVPSHHRGTVCVVLRLRGATCLERATLLQRWDADHGWARPLVIGVRRGPTGFAAHAWLDGDRSAAHFAELHRRAAVGPLGPAPNISRG